MNNCMKDLFPGQFKESEGQLQKIWESAVFVFDANILLNLYRYSDTTQNEFLEILDRIKERVWLPHRAAEEYFNNRLTVISQQEKSYGETVNAIDNLESKLKNSRQHPFVSNETMATLEELFNNLRQELTDNQNVHSKRISKDLIKDRIAAIFESRVGSPYEKDELTNLLEEGKERYRQQIPPGFKDSTKPNKDDIFLDECKKYGDLIVWRQIIDKALDSDIDIILVTDDKKEDWWELFKGKTIGPRPKLVKEFHEKVNKTYQMYQADRFLQLASSFLGESVSDEAVNEIKQVRLDSNFELSLNKHQAFSDLVGYVQENIKLGDKLPSERNLAEILGWTRTVVREQLVRLESFDFISIEHGKSTVLLKEIPE